jgi:hypothetical protein
MGGEPRHPSVLRLATRGLLALQIAVVAVAVPLALHRQTLLGSAVDTNADGDVRVTYRLEPPGGIPADHLMWLALPVAVVTGHEPVTVTSARIVTTPGVEVHQVIRISIAASGGVMHVLEDRYFRSYGIAVDGPLAGTVFRPGEPTVYGAVGVTFAHPGRYRVAGFRVTYRDAAGRHGSQIFPVDYRLLIGPPDS